MGVTMTNAGDVVVRIQIGVAIGVVQPNPFTPHDMQRLVVEQSIRRSKQSLAPLNQQPLPFLEWSIAGNKRIDHGHPLDSS